MKYIIILFLIFQNILFADDAGKILSKVEKKYKSIEDAYIEFTQVNVFGVSKFENRIDGKLWMKKQNKYRIELEHQTIVTDGKTVWSYYPLNEQVIIDFYKDEQNPYSPDKIMVNIPKNYNPVLIGSEKISNKKCFVLKLTPRDPNQMIKHMKVFVDQDEYTIQKVETIDLGDNQTIYFVNAIKLNTGIDNSRFNFTNPQNVEILDLRQINK